MPRALLIAALLAPAAPAAAQVAPPPWGAFDPVRTSANFVNNIAGLPLRLPEGGGGAVVYEPGGAVAGDVDREGWVWRGGRVCSDPLPCEAVWRTEGWVAFVAPDGTRRFLALGR